MRSGSRPDGVEAASTFGQREFLKFVRLFPETGRARNPRRAPPSSCSFARSPGEDRMSKELVISSNRHETRVALIEDEQVVEIYHQRENEYSLAGSIHKGRVTRVLPGMQSAFVDIGLERDAF